MRPALSRLTRVSALCFLSALAALPGFAQPQHGIAMYGAPALPPDFVALPQANPQAPKGGTVTFGEAGSFDSLNPFITKGQAPGAVSPLTVETLMARNYDEPFALYGLLAESIDTDDSRSYVEFTLREGATFSDGSPVTVEDVLWSMETLGTQGNPRYAAAWKKVAKAEATGPRSVRFTFAAPDRELPLLLGLRPVLKKAQFQGRDFAEAGLTAVIGSGPYVVGKVDAGTVISFTRRADWWGRDLPINQGLWNFDTIKYQYFADPTVMIEAMKAGTIDLYRESNAAKWERDYDFPAVTSGEVVKEEIPHQRPSGMNGFVFNTRKPIFADWRVREALTLSFNFEFVNQSLNAGKLPRADSYFANSELAGDVAAPASDAVAALLAPYGADLLPGALEGYALPQGDGSEANRGNIRKATALLEEAGWTVQDGVLRDASGTPLAFELLLANGAADAVSAANIWAQSLEKLGVKLTITTSDSAAYKERITKYDYDMIYNAWSLSLSPGNEQTLYWGADGVTTEGTRNYMGVGSKAVDGLISTMVSSKDREDFVTSVQALDRVLTSGRYVIPFWYSDVSRVAHNSALHHPERLPLYGDWLGFLPDVWWFEAK
ncbi:extracellular solute-binding protein [Rhodobacter sp. KR11]|uniref:extracellular solute-binding protein n=1 Tax=Rhodobacter sp. KR11 TaxID=2974588 RepID=UPI0039B6D503